MTQDELTALLTGTYVRLWPYSPPYFPRDTLYQVWKLMEAHKAWPRLFWWEDVNDLHKGSLLAFASYMKTKAALLVESLETGKLAGLVWFDEMFDGLRGTISVWYARSAWGAAAHEATGIATRYGHQALSLPQVWGVTPWTAARHHALRCGYKDMATFPRYIRLNGKPMPMYFLCHED